MEQPAIRVGLKTDVRSVSLTYEGALYVSDGGSTRRVQDRIVASPAFLATISTSFSVQVESFSTRENAQKAQGILKQKTSRPTFVFYNADRNLEQLRLGPFSTKELAQQVVDEMKRIGYSGAFYVSDEGNGGNSRAELVLRDESGSVVLKTSGRAQIWTDPLTLTLDMEPYRGYMEVFVNKVGRLTVVNVVNFEEYLKGVVPNEIGGGSSETYEALKAQAVAARTYAYKNLKQFDKDGYDLCATPRCQVYSGMKNESSLTAKAIEETRGEVLTYSGEAINALYTSTCGGRTENAEFMFENMNFPYLKSVHCYTEETNTRPATGRFEGRIQPWWLAWVNAKTGKSFGGDLTGPLDKEEVIEATSGILDYLGKNSCDLQAPSGTDWVSIGDYLVRQLCWQAKRDALLTEKDYQYFLSHLSFSLEPKEETHSFLFLFHDGILEPDAATLNRFNPYLPMKRQDFFRALFQILEHYHQINPSNGTAREVFPGEIQVVDELGVHLFQLDKPSALYQLLNGNRVPREDLACSPGDKVEYLAVDGRIRILACELNQTGAAVDRSSKYSFWRDVVSPSDLGQRVSKYADVGDVVDLQPLTYGASGRVYEMKITGSKTTAVLSGIRVRWALGLKDNLFTIDRTLEKNGRVRSFIFTGRGWGHGVGMCQVGALGYARQGKDHRDILLHYYTGARIERKW